MENMFQIKIDENEYCIFKEREFNIIGHPNFEITIMPNYFDLKVISSNNTNIDYPVTLNLTVQNKEQTEKDQEYEYMYGNQHKNNPQIIYKNNGYSLNISSNLTFIYINNKPLILKTEKLMNPKELKLNVDLLPLTQNEYEMFYEEYLKQMSENPTQDYLEETKFRQEIENAKKIIKKRNI